MGSPHGAGRERPPRPVDYDAELQLHTELLLQACAVQPGDHVLDIGCGTGQTTREAARIARTGSALGVDISAAAIRQARRLARAQGLWNVTFERADVQTCHLARERFDVATSRFGTMFFDDPVAALANIRQALRPAGRLVMMVWQTHERNEWDVTIRQALGQVAAVRCEQPDPFSLADPPTVEKILRAAGFAAITFTDVREPVYYGPDVDTALAWVRSFACTNDALSRLEPASTTRALGRLRDALAAHLNDEGVWFNARAWTVTARRRRGRTER